MKNLLVGLLIIAAMLVSACSQETSEMEQIRKNKEAHVPMMERSPYKEIRSYLHKEKPEELIELLRGTPMPPGINSAVGAGLGAERAKIYLNHFEKIKSLTDNEALHDFIAEIEPYFEKAATSSDKEVQSENLNEGERYYGYLSQTTKGLN
ncbi:hypothetical protein QWY14_10320 [Planococcus sp. N028]|uniref:Lipoprotein n=1 Tax=Planococcus shixiaomingii TaxID=3058393 RepID=A0ABT8N2S3_9BACL|nr:hypothetical protein [Planococcus sp. N028]MDN7242196.1 hypothetical protein [Planococcus sp. N028]